MRQHVVQDREARLHHPGRSRHTRGRLLTSRLTAAVLDVTDSARAVRRQGEQRAERSIKIITFQRPPKSATP
ncbi:hypothetical protein HII36_40685 [Nonomuraea sp. NN258]|uniref:hypothetical protein n=1 Tax=Nonomuraea antri TaxID=2730852 RepID=UPI001569A3A2|nr:hypothetical protein [Nonomuraea antri]NRQ38103.1 hypothetical protein [Nonomuraea antri]